MSRGFAGAAAGTLWLLSGASVCTLLHRPQNGLGQPVVGGYLCIGFTAGGGSDYLHRQVDAGPLYVTGVQMTAMLRAELIRPPDHGSAAEAAYLPPAWRVAQFARVDAGSRSFWFDMVDDQRFGPTVAMIARPDRLQRLLRGTNGAPLLPPSWLSSSHVDTLAVLHADWPQIEARLLEFAADFGISPASSRTLVALLQTGDVRSAASVAGISYETAREYLDGARAQIGAGNLQRPVTLMGLGIVPTLQKTAAGVPFMIRPRHRKIAPTRWRAISVAS